MHNIIYHRHLPHLHYIGSAFFLTWRLHGSLPRAILDREQARLDDDLLAIAHSKLSVHEKAAQEEVFKSKYLHRLDDYLDTIATGPHHLKNKMIAENIVAKLHQYDGKYYRLEAFCVMSNHVHVLFDFGVQLPESEADFVLANYVHVDKVLKLIKGGTGYECNKLLQKTGKFWSDKNFDRYIRNQKHYNTFINYIINNPVKAGICKEWQNYPHTYLRPYD